jgi:hypothetical protein
MLNGHDGGVLMRCFWAAAILLGVVMLSGCGGRSATVTGRVTCQGKPVPGEIIFSPKGVSEENKGPAVNASLDEDGRYTVKLTSYGSHRISIRPSEMPAPETEGKAFPCDLSTLERNVNPGSNEIVIDLAKREP